MSRIKFGITNYAYFIVEFCTLIYLYIRFFKTFYERTDFFCRRLVENLKSYKLCFVAQKKQDDISNKLKGQSIVISGVFKEYSRKELKALVEKHGGKNVSSISKNTTFVLFGDNMGPSKKIKAESLGINIISEDDFIQLIN